MVYISISIYIYIYIYIIYIYIYIYAEASKMTVMCIPINTKMVLWQPMHLGTGCTVPMYGTNC